MTIEQSSTCAVTSLRAANRYAAHLRSYVENRGIYAARTLREAAVSASAGWMHVISPPASITKRQPWIGAATAAAVAVVIDARIKR